MLSALSHYLQHLPLPNQDSARTGATSAISSTAADEPADATPGAYAPSARAVLVSAVAADFNVRALRNEEVGALQNTLLQFGLLDGRGLDAFAALNTARADLQPEQRLDAVQTLDDLAEQFEQRQIPYSERQQIGRLQTLLHNLDSARQTH